MRLILLLLAAGLAGAVFERIGSPLPWMIGPLVIVAAISMLSRRAPGVPLSIRPFGQIVVACQVGLTFSPVALERLLSLAPVIVGTALMSGIVVLALAFAFARCSRLTLTQAFLGSVPTSPVEAVSMAAKTGIDPMPVALSQTLRLSAVVVLVPFALYLLDGWPETPRTALRPTVFDPAAIALLAALGLSGTLLFRFLRFANPNFLGPIAVTAAFAASGNAPEPFPPQMLAVAQVILGAWLGSNFRRELLSSAAPVAAACVLSALSTLAACSLGSFAIALIFGLDWRTLLLGAAPGGVVEMALTAKFLGQDVALITAFHLTRIFIFMPNIPWVVTLIARLDSREGVSP